MIVLYAYKDTKKIQNTSPCQVF